MAETSPDGSSASLTMSLLLRDRIGAPGDQQVRSRRYSVGAEFEVAGVITQRAHSRGVSTRRSCLRQIGGIRRDKNEHVGFVDNASRTHCRL